MALTVKMLKGLGLTDEQREAILAYYNPQPRPAYVVPNPNFCYQGCGTCA